MEKISSAPGTNFPIKSEKDGARPLNSSPSEFPGTGRATGSGSVLLRVLARASHSDNTVSRRNGMTGINRIVKPYGALR